MISQLKLINFQSHRVSILDFHPGVNIIIGSSDSGKTAIIRALRWLIWNRPLGNDFRSVWGGRTVVQVETIDENIIKRQEGKEKLYKLNSTEFNAFGTDVPSEITYALNIDDINVQQQLDSPFLIDNSSGEVAQHFNRIANLEKIGTAQSNIKQWITEIKSEITRNEKSLITEKQKLSEYDYLEKFEIDVEVLEDMAKQIQAKRSHANQLSNLINSITDVLSKIKIEQERTKGESTVNNLLENIELRKQKKLEWNRMDQIIKNIESINEEYVNLDDLVRNDKLVSKLISLCKEGRIIQLDIDRLKKVVQNAVENDENIITKRENLKQLQKQFDENFPDVCPLCGKEQ